MTIYAALPPARPQPVSQIPVAGLRSPLLTANRMKAATGPNALTFSGMPMIKGTISRRILVNFTADPDTVQKLLPAPFRPKLIKGKAVVGMCIIRLEKIRPSFLPKCIGLSSENMAHRISVEWDENGVTKEGVYVLRRDSNSFLNKLLGGRLFPGVHHKARFTVKEKDDHYQLKIDSKDKVTAVELEGTVSKTMPETSIFDSVETASDFFAQGAVGYSSSSEKDQLEGVELRIKDWKVEPLELSKVASTFYENDERFPKGTIQYDSALLMRNLEHEWHDQGPLCIDNCKIG